MHILDNISVENISNKYKDSRKRRVTAQLSLVRDKQSR